MTGVIFGYTRNELLTLRNALIVYKAQALNLKEECAGERDKIKKIDVALGETDKILGDVLQAMVDLDNPYPDLSQGGH
jgi:hypothetical protein